MSAADTTLILIDLQARLMPAIERGEVVLGRCAVLARAARILGIPVVATEQNPNGLGPTVPALAGLVERTVAKTSFDGAADGLVDAIPPSRRRLVVAGCETHVCVLQTVLGLRARGFDVALAADAAGSRRAEDRAAAIERMRRHGAEIVTSEMAVFEWLRRSDHPNFRELLALVR